MWFLIFIGILAVGSLIGVVLHRGWLGVTWPIRAAVHAWGHGRREIAYVLSAIAVAYIGWFLIWLNNRPGWGWGSLIWPELLLAAAVWIVPEAMRARDRRPDHREPYPDDHPAMDDDSWRYR